MKRARWVSAWKARCGSGRTRRRWARLYVRTDRLDREQVNQIKAVGKMVEMNDNNVAHNYLPLPDGRFLRHYRVRAMTTLTDTPPGVILRSAAGSGAWACPGGDTLVSPATK